MMAAEQRGILAIWHDVIPDYTSKVLAWYNAEHHFERLAVPGFISVRRYHAVQGSPALFIRYETRNVGVLSSEAYLARLNDPTPWTLQSQPRFLNNSRTVCVRKSRVGQAEGGYAVTLRIGAKGNETALTDRNWATVSDILRNKDRIVGLELWEADHERSTIATREKQLRGGEDRYVGSVIIVHATDRGAADEALNALLSALPEDISKDAQSGIYALAFLAQNSTL
ncbi:hypothetical protein DC522_17995 [Microvirga sp. KLBC 81]|uniref:hypothetical protein n=1 Tax=Microvirga sp. KLBC 81 TaxID=1862707 RepID=UPI000D51B12C|nr:hypothetical protein [Microvirga sp. KLBC 81]PVE22989.1 hypothetical protein DC522_17995 [Microvirga sp. KLBC 81]